MSIYAMISTHYCVITYVNIVDSGDMQVVQMTGEMLKCHSE